MEKREKRSSGAVVLFMACLVVLFLAYVLSVGPAVGLMERGYLSETWWPGIYYPLTIASDAVPPVGYALSWYISYFYYDRPPEPQQKAPVGPVPDIEPPEVWIPDPV